jgi:hypothetical protein
MTVWECVHTSWVTSVSFAGELRGCRRSRPAGAAADEEVLALAGTHALQ